MLARFARRSGAPLLACAAAWALSGSATAQPKAPIDLELVLAVDVSASMDEDELQLQRRGYADAFRHKAVADAIASLAGGRIAVTFLEWAAEDEQSQIIPWTVIASAQDARGFADRLDAAPLFSEQRTSISSALITAAGLLEDNDFDGVRRVIDISGDGANNNGPPVEEARAAVLRKGIVINGLPIMLGKPPQWYDVPYLDRYYRDCVIGGQGSFVIPMRDVNQWAATIRRKLVSEIAGLAPRNEAPLFQLAQLSAPSRTDCLIGEKQWRSRMGRGFDFDPSLRFNNDR